MSAARKSEKPEAHESIHQSGEHAIGLDAMIRRSIEIAFAEVREEPPDPQMTARMSAFDLEVALAESKPTVPPDDGTVRISDLPMPAVEIDRTK